MTRKSPPDISVVLITYNHALYIDGAMRSIFNQDFNGMIELIIADDASSDNTIEIIKKYENKDSRFIFRYLAQDKNLGVTKNYQRAFAACTGKYAAIIEGDDMWTNKEKLTKQTKVLDDHAEIVLCSSNYFIWNEDAGRYRTRTSVDQTGFMYYDTPYIIDNNLPGNFSACVYRVETLRKIPKELFEHKLYDWGINIFVGTHGLFAYMHEPLSTYRIHDQGVWSQMSSVQKLNEQIETAEKYNEMTGRRYETEFNYLIRRLKINQSLESNTNILFFRKFLKRLKRLAVSITPPFFISILRLILPPIVFLFISRI